MPECKCVSVEEITFDGAVPIDGYGPGFFRVAGQLHRGAMLICESGTIPWQGYDDMAALLERAGTLDLVIVGTGDKIAYPPRAFRDALQALDIGVEFMQTSAACRTYNVLLAEGRRMAGVFFPVEE